MRAIILAGGLGTRLRPLTDHTAKPLLPVGKAPIMQHAIENLVQHGITEILLGVSYHADKIQDYFGDGKALGAQISYSVEEEPLGTGGAVVQANNKDTETFLLVWGDNIASYDWTQMIKSHKKNNALLTMALTEREDVEHFGVAALNGEKIIGFVEKPKREDAPSHLINAGAFVIEPKILEILPQGKSNIERECFEKIMVKGKSYAHIHQGYWFPTDTIEKYDRAQEYFSSQ